MKYIKIENLDSASHIKVVYLNRPDVKNSFHPEMIREITETFQSFANDKNLQAIALKGEGTAFCAGADLNWMKEMVNYSFEQNIQDSEKLWNMFEAISFCEVPVIGIVHGAVYGGAVGLVACCDYVIAEEKTQFCFSEVKLGLAPAVISSFVLRKTADGFVRPLMLSAEVFSTKTAQRTGLVHEIKDDIDKCWKQELQKFQVNGLQAMRETKKLLNIISNSISWSEQKKITTKVISERRISQEGQDRLKKFIEKK